MNAWRYLQLSYMDRSGPCRMDARTTNYKLSERRFAVQPFNRFFTDLFAHMRLSERSSPN